MIARMAAAVLIAMGIALASLPVRADLLQKIEATGVLTVGVKNDYQPFGFIDETGGLAGYDVDVARAIAEHLQVSLQLIAVTSANRLQRLAAGEIDMVIATLGDTVERRALVTMVEPQYYGDGANVLLRPDFNVERWADLRGHTVCGVQGAVWNRPMSQRLLLEVRALGGIREARLALSDGRCVGWLYDEVALRQEMQGGELADYALPLPTQMVLPWAIALPASERGGALDRRVGDLVAEWHRSGWLLELERQWGLPPSPFLAAAARQWSAVDSDDRPLCRRDALGRWPLGCLDSALATSSSADGIAGLSLYIRELTGLDLSPVYDGYDRNLILSGLLTTLLLCFSAMVGSLIVGVGVGWLIHLRVPVLRQVLIGFMSVARMTPPLLQLYVVFFGLGGLLVARGFTLDSFAIVVLVFSVYAGATNAAAFADAADVVSQRRDGRKGLVKDDLRAALALSMGTIAGSSVNLVKATGMASAIAVPELVHASTAIVADKGNAAVMMNLLLIIYFVLVGAVVAGFAALGRRLERP